MSVTKFGFDDFGGQAALLLDTRRVGLFKQALAQSIGPDDVVADVGSGSGVLAVLAAQAGARRVFAVERGPMAELAEQIVRENGLQERITVIRGEARDVTFPEPPSLMVSETLGVFGADEDIVMNRGLWAWEVRTATEVRQGDALRAGTGSRESILASVRLRERPVGERKPSARLEAWAAALEGRVSGDVEAMAVRLLRACPERYAGLSDARQEIIALLHAGEALR